MTHFGGSFRFVQLPAIAQLLAELGSTGRLRVSHAAWTGEIVVRDGQLVGARLGTEQGRAALEGIAVALPDAEFRFTDEPVAEAGDALVTAAERTAYLDRLGAEHQRLVKLIPSLWLVPRLIDPSDNTSASDNNSALDASSAQVTIAAAALRLVPALVYGHTLEQIARARGLVRTLRDVATLMEGGLVKLDSPPSVATQAPVVAQQAIEKPHRDEPARNEPAAARPVGDTLVGEGRPFGQRSIGDTLVVAQHIVEKPVHHEPAGDTPVGEGRPFGPRSIGDRAVGETPPVGKTGVDKPAPVLPFSARPFAVRSSASTAVRSVAVAAEESTQPSGVSRQMPPRLSVARHSTPGTVSALPPAVIPPAPAVIPPAPAVIPPSVAARVSAGHNFAIEPLAPPPSAIPPRVNVASWRKAIVRFFFTDEPGA